MGEHEEHARGGVAQIPEADRPHLAHPGVAAESTAGSKQWHVCFPDIAFGARAVRCSVQPFAHARRRAARAQEPDLPASGM